MEEPTAIRHPGRGKAHRETPGLHPINNWLQPTACGRHTRVEVDQMKRVPLSSVPPADRCRKCWPDD